MQPTESMLRGSDEKAASPGVLADRPDFISEDPLRERQICAAIDGLASADVPDRAAATPVLRFLDEESNVHLRDEMDDLFPLPARRCTEEDAIEGTIDQIGADQEEAMRLLPEMRVMLAGGLDRGADLTARERAVLSRFAGQVRRHLVAGNAIPLPIARARLTRADLRTLPDRMRSRRGLTDFPEPTDAE